MSKMIKVGMADYKIVKAPDLLTTLGLGSCVGICLYDSVNKIAGMAHIMLPDGNIVKNNTNPAKFADTGIKLLIDEMEKLGAIKRRLSCKIAGGAQMFKFDSKSDMMKIGTRNSEAVKEIMLSLGIPIIAEDVGGNFGRTIEFYSEDGSLFIKTIGHGTKTI